MPIADPLFISRQLLLALGTKLYIHHADRVPHDTAVVVVSNHRSFMDALVLMVAMQRSVRFACHHYMGQVPVLKDCVTRLGCFPLDAPDQRQRSFMVQASQFLAQQECVGVFPEGTQPMVQQTTPTHLGKFHRGFAHLALRAPVRDLAILPIAIASQDETISPAFPTRFLSWFDPSEPLFQTAGWHPLVVYQRADVLVGKPIWVNASQQAQYHGKQAKTVINDLTDECYSTIANLLKGN